MTEPTDRLMPIGRFAAVTGLSVTTLRHYDEVGLLAPAWVDPRSGYRYYRAGQTTTAGVVRRLRGAGMGVRAIRDVLDAWARPDVVCGLLEAHEREMQGRLTDATRELQAVQRLAKGGDMHVIGFDDVDAAQLVDTIRRGDVDGLARLLEAHAGLAAARVAGDDGHERPLLMVVADWPAHVPNGARMIRMLVESGADPNATFVGPHAETALHWAASANDIEVLDALLDAGADIDAPGAVIAGGTPLEDAVAFAQWRAAHRLVARGARVTMGHAAALGMLEEVERQGAEASADDVTFAFWLACHAGQPDTARYLLGRGAQLNWLTSWDQHTPLDAARRAGAAGLVEWLRAQGAKGADEL